MLALLSRSPSPISLVRRQIAWAAQAMCRLVRYKKGHPPAKRLVFTTTTNNHQPPTIKSQRQSNTPKPTSSTSSPYSRTRSPPSAIRSTPCRDVDAHRYPPPSSSCRHLSLGRVYPRHQRRMIEQRSQRRPPGPYLQCSVHFQSEYWGPGRHGEYIEIPLTDVPS